MVVRMTTSALGRPAHSNTLLSARTLTALATSIGVSFLLAYFVFHGLHALHRDPVFVTRLASIPLFAICEASAIFGFLGGALITPVIAENDRIYRQIAKVLLASVLLFTLQILLFP
ncbi:MAG TPA: hypothetical protein VHV51_09615 [Polyangiaceae bacterium]|jgi:hypothetical protein|nr:hypothetical protein [Polyangiaceae bacterium]